MSVRSSRRAVPLLVLGESRTSALRQRLDSVVKSWHQTWSSEGASPPVTELATEGAEHETRNGAVAIVASRDETVLLCAIASGDIGRLLVGAGAAEGLAAVSPPTEGLSASLTENIIRELCKYIVESALPGARCTLERQPPSSRHIANLTAARSIAATVAFGKGLPAIELVLEAEVVDALLGPRPLGASSEGMTSRRRATNDQSVRVTAVLGTAAVSWRDLTTLAAGEVLVLDQTLESPCALVVGDDTRIADAQLGTRGGALAVQITRITPEATRPRGPYQ